VCVIILTAICPYRWYKIICKLLLNIKSTVVERLWHNIWNYICESLSTYVCQCNAIFGRCIMKFYCCLLHAFWISILIYYNHLIKCLITHAPVNRNLQLEWFLWLLLSGHFSGVDCSVTGLVCCSLSVPLFVSKLMRNMDLMCLQVLLTPFVTKYILFHYNTLHLFKVS